MPQVRRVCPALLANAAVLCCCCSPPLQANRMLALLLHAVLVSLPACLPLAWTEAWRFPKGRPMRDRTGIGLVRRVTGSLA